MFENLISILLGFQVWLTYIALGIAVITGGLVVYQLFRARNR